MPKKTCPECSKKLGVRTKICKCGFKFEQEGKDKKKRDLPSNEAVGVGTWVLENFKNMPKISQPAPLDKKKKYSRIEIRDIVSYEGIGFCIMDYISSKMIDDGELSKMWEEAKTILIKIKKYIYK